jgi:hypothetical protein
MRPATLPQRDEAVTEFIELVGAVDEIQAQREGDRRAACDIALLLQLDVGDRIVDLGVPFRLKLLERGLDHLLYQGRVGSALHVEVSMDSHRKTLLSEGNRWELVGEFIRNSQMHGNHLLRHFELCP